MSIATELGSDVPAMLAGGPVMVSGRGEALTPVHTVTTWWVLKPFDVAVTAADAYGWWDERPRDRSRPRRADRGARDR